MIDFHAEIVEALSAVLPTHYEMTLSSGTETPCISYMETNNYVVENGDTQAYSYLGYQVKVWAHSLADIQKYAKQVDNVLRPLGFNRTSSGELYDNESTLIQKIMIFEALLREEFKEDAI